MIDGKPDLIETLAREGIDLRRGWGLCPFHADKNPSFKVDIQKQKFKCFGCGEGGDVIDFIQKFHRLDFKGALAYLGLSPGTYRPNPALKRKRELLANFEQWRRETYRDLCDEYNQIWRALRRCKAMEEIGELSEVMCEMGPMEDIINTLSGVDSEAIYELYCASI